MIGQEGQTDKAVRVCGRSVGEETLKAEFSKDEELEAKKFVEESNSEI